jgi:hypothetical protein
MQTLKRKLTWLCLFISVNLLVSPMSRVSANVDLSYFKATGVLNQVVLEWQTASELTTVGFNLYRAESAAGPFTQKLNSAMIPGLMGSPVGKTYTFNDTGVSAGKTYYYQLEGISSTTGSKRYDVKSAAPQVAATPTKTKTPVSTNTPASTATRTSTLVPGAPTFTPAPTDPPTPIPTATNTLVPGAPTFTPAPKATPTAPRIAVAPKPGALTDPALAVAPNAPVPGAGANPTPINLAPQSANSSAEDEFAEDMPENDTQSPAPAWRSLALVGVLLTAGGIGFVGVLLFGLAALFFVRAQSRR